MKIGIYKIQNLITKECYIGQSVDIYKRWEDERNAAFNINHASYNYPLSKAFRKYGINNFSFEILEECQRQELNKKEIEWIIKYDSYNHGYNQTPGGDTTLHMCKLTPEKALEIIEILANDLEGLVSHKQLAIDYGVSKDTIQAINAGRQWYNDNYSYPLHISKFDPRYVKEKPIKQSKIPINKEELEQILWENKGNFTQVGRIFGVSDNAIRKWCKKFNLSHYSKDYKQKNNKIININYHRKVRCIEEDLIFSCAAEAAQWLVDNGKSQSINSSKNNIPKVCRGERETHAKYHWEYV